MLEYVLAITSLVLVIVISIVGYFYIQQLKKDNWDSIQGLVQEINQKKKYEYEFETKQMDNLRVADGSIMSMSSTINDIKNHVDSLNSTTIKYGDDLMASGILPDENGYVTLSAAGEPKILINPENDNIYLRGNVYICNPLGQNCNKIST